MPAPSRRALAIPHYVLDYEARFRRAVIEPFAAAYAAGETPVPCAACNSAVKFADLLDTARDLGADALATGHYCITRALPGGGRGLFRGADPARDQSYFLYATTPAQLAPLRFPLGALPKAQVRALAQTFGLRVADKPDSQDICFVPHGRYTDTVARLRPEAAVPGDVVDGAGRVLGRHEGIVHYTVGQRRGLNLGSQPANAGEPLFVTAVDPATARVVVGPREALLTREVALSAVNWLGDGRLADCPRPACRSLPAPARPGRPPLPPSTPARTAWSCASRRRSARRRRARPASSTSRTRPTPACSAAAPSRGPPRASGRRSASRRRRRDALRPAAAAQLDDRQGGG